MANVPFGALREHTEKFSPAWILTVHATVPFFAFMRKGVGMPKWAIGLTVVAAVLGQAVGARLERARYAVKSSPHQDCRIELVCIAEEYFCKSINTS